MAPNLHSIFFFLKPRGASQQGPEGRGEGAPGSPRSLTRILSKTPSSKAPTLKTQIHHLPTCLLFFINFKRWISVRRTSLDARRSAPSCGESIRAGFPCRHVFCAHRPVQWAGFHVHLINPRWHLEPIEEADLRTWP
mmetsp:Transcript_39215/g.111032  ORF Transcript_39215/g.111032 Transcript_39215/m.111032 type:complete len:137 (-) Transcript_39215:204-614(-)